MGKLKKTSGIHKGFRRATSCIALTLPSLLLNACPVSAEAAPRLVLQITVDALRGDLPQRFSGVLGKGGFHYLHNERIYYTNAQYQHANTEAIVGHVSLATGAPPAGLADKAWEFTHPSGK